MSPTEVLAYQIEWAAQDTAHNLDFIPADKLAWKPAPTSKSVLEIVNEMVHFAMALRPVLSGGNFTPVEFAPATTVATAKELLLASAQDYAKALRAVPLAELDRPVDMGFMTLPLVRAAGMPVVEMIHHRGQIVYIQTLLNDTEDHFDMAAV